MAHDASVKAKVRANYIQGMPLEQAAELAGIAYNTARNWKRKAGDEGDDWDVARHAKRLSKGSVSDLTGEILESMVEQFAATTKAMQNTEGMPPMQKAEILLKLSDAYVKTMAAAARGNPRLDRLSMAMDLLRELSAYVAEHFPQLREPFLELIESFGPEVVRLYGTAA